MRKNSLHDILKLPGNWPMFEKNVRRGKVMIIQLTLS